MCRIRKLLDMFINNMGKPCFSRVFHLCLIFSIWHVFIFSMPILGIED